MEEQNKFTNLYSRSLTLRFEAKPVGKTEENFRRNFLQKDKDRAEKYKEAKLIIDNYHRWHIETVLKHISIDEKKLVKFYEIYCDKDYKERENSLSSLQKDFRETISKELLKNKKAFINREKCIKCYCCQELCPKKAIKVKRSVFFKLPDIFSKKK